MKIYLIGSLRNPNVPLVANELREAGHDVFDDWYSPGPEADDKWQEYEHTRKRSYRDALQGYHARHVFDFDMGHLLRSDVAVLLLPAGKSAHMELGWFLGQGKPGYVLFDTEPERFDIMYNLATDIFFSTDELIKELNHG